MSRIELILVPIDFGPHSQHALEYAVGLAEQLGAAVHVITAYELPIASFPDGVYVPSAEIATRLIEASQASLDKACAPFKNGKVKVTSHLEQGDPREVVLELCKVMPVGLIVMGTHGRKGIARALIGSVAESVIRTSTVPVLTVH